MPGVKRLALQTISEFGAARRPYQAQSAQAIQLNFGLDFW